MNDNPFDPPESQLGESAGATGVSLATLEAREAAGSLYMEYYVRPEDLVEQWLLRYMAKIGRRRRLVFLAGAAIWVLLAWQLGDGVALAIAIGLGLYAFGRKWLTRRAFRKQVDLMQGSDYLGPQKMTLHGDKFVREADYVESHVQWRGIEKITADQWGVHLQFNPAQILHIPQRDFGSPEAANFLADRIRQLSRKH